MKILGRYRNGNYNVMLLDDGTKMRCNDKDSFVADRPESIDLKITNQCDMRCRFCHENSSPDGKHGDIMNLKFIDTMLPYSECAIGGGNPLLHPDLVPFLDHLKERKIVASMTVNQLQLYDNLDFIKDLVDKKLIYGLGVSLTAASGTIINIVKQFPNAVIHVINGIVHKDELEALAHNDLKILILGYKQFRRGKDWYSYDGESIDKLKAELYKTLPEIVNDGWFKCVSFDNLAIEQLDPKRFMSDDEWSSFYLGNDGFVSMYIDAVNRKFAKSSVSTERYELMDDIADMFKIVKENANE